MSRPDQTRSEKRARTLAALGRLPINPGPLAAIMQTDGSDTDALIRALAQCPILTARVIGVANAAGSSAVHRMDTIERCVRHLGGKQTRTVALTLAMQMFTQDLDIDEKLTRSLWASATTKAVAASIAAEVVTPQHAERAYSVGLVQDIALPVLLALDAGFFTQTLAQADGRFAWTELEQEHFGIDHAELGATLLQRWGAPQALIDQVARHHAALGDDDMAWVAEMPSRFAGLLPHLDEKPTKAQAQTLAAAHTRLLAGQYKTLDDFTVETRKRVAALGKAAAGPAKLPPDFAQQVALAVAHDTFALVAKVTRLDHQLADQIDRMANMQTDALTDPLTGLLNRRGLEAFGIQTLAQADKAGLAAACLVIDLDDFKPINDNFGHAAGDTLLKAAAELLRSNVASGDLVARLGGDEFAVLVLATAQGDAHALAQRVHATCNGRRIPIGGGRKAELKMSIGGVYEPRITEQTSIDTLLDAADHVMYRCKQGGKSRMLFEAAKRTAA